MEGIHVASSSPEQQEDSWTCQRCGWVFPNARPSAKHRRNHRKHCGKIKGFEPHLEMHKGGSSDEVSSDDGSHENKDNLPLQFAQTQHDSIRPVEAATVAHVVKPPGASQFRDRVVLPPETNDIYVKKSEVPVHNIVEVKPEVSPYESTRNVDIIDIVNSNSSAAGPNIGPCDETSTSLGDAKELKVKDTLGGDLEKIAASDIPEGYNHVGHVSGLQGVDVAASDHIDPSLQIGSMHANAAPKYPGGMTSLNEPSKTIEGEGRGSTDKDIEESQLLESDQSKDTEKLTTTPAERSINRQGSSLEDDSWTCRRCGWIYPNPHPSAKHRRNHKKHCGKLKGLEVQTEPHKRGSSDEVSSDEEKKGHIQHDIHNESSPIIQGKNSASSLTLASTTISSEGQSGDHSTSKASCAAADRSGEAASINGTPTLMLFSSDSKLNPESVPLASVDAPTTSAKDEVIGQRDGCLKEPLTFSVDKVAARPHVTELPTASLDNPGVDVSEERPMAHKNDKSSDSRPTAASIDSKSEAIPKGGPPALVRGTPVSLDNPGVDVSEERLMAHKNDKSSDSRPTAASIESKSGATPKGGPPALVRDTPEDTLLMSANNVVLGQTDRALEVISTCGSDKVVERPPIKEVLIQSSDNPGLDISDERPAHLTGELSLNDDRPISATIESKSEAISERGPPLLVRDTQGTGAKDEVLHQTDGGIEETSTFSMDNVRDTPGTSTKDEILRQTDGGIGETSTSSMDNKRDTPVSSSKDEVLGQKGGVIEETSTSGTYMVVERPQVTEMPTQFSVNARVDFSEALITDSPEDTLAASARDEVLGKIDGGIEETSTSSMDKVVERPHMTEMPTLSLDNPGMDVSEERRIAHTTVELSSSDKNSSSTAMELKSDAIPERGPPAMVEDLVVTRPADTLATSARDEVLGQTDGGIEETHTSNMDKVVVRPQATGMPTLSSDNPGVDVSEERRMAHTTGELSSSDNNSSLTTMESKSDAIPERGPLAMVGDPVATRPEDRLATSGRDGVLGQTDGCIEETSISSMDKVVVRPQATEMPTVSSDNSGVDVSEERRIAHTTGGLSSSDNSSSSTTMELKFDAILERGPPAMVGDPLVSRPEDTLATSAREGILGQTDGGIEETSTSSMDRVVERPLATEMLTLSLDNPGVDVSHIVHTTGELSSSDTNIYPTTIELKSDAIPERGPPALVGYSVATSSIGNIANNSGLSSSPKEGGLMQSSLEENNYEGKSADVYGPLEVSEKPDSKHNEFFEADFGSPGRSLDGTNSFTHAESDFSQRSEFAASSHKLSDSLEIFEDATDTLEACSVGGSAEESESLDEPRHAADGVDEDSECPLHERVTGAQSFNVMNGATNELELKPNGMNAGEASSEEKATTVLAGTYAVPARMDELKAPSPEAWQEPGPSTSAKKGKNVIISEVIEDGKYGESQTALRSLMSMEGKDKMDQAVASPLVEIDPQSFGGKEASANGKKPKSRLRSFWSHCVCCPAVQ